MENKKGNELSKSFWIILIAICVVLAITMGVLLVAFLNKEDEVIDKVESGGNIILNYTKNITGLSITNAIPTADAIGMKESDSDKYFDFSVNVELDNATSIDYEIAVVKDTKSSTILDDDIRIYLEKENSGTYMKVFGPSPFTGISKVSDLGSEKGSMILTNVTTKKSTTDNYRLRLWLSDTSLLTSGSYSVEVIVNGKAN